MKGIIIITKRSETVNLPVSCGRQNQRCNKGMLACPRASYLGIPIFEQLKVGELIDLYFKRGGEKRRRKEKCMLIHCGLPVILSLQKKKKKCWQIFHDNFTTAQTNEFYFSAKMSDVHVSVQRCQMFMYQCIDVRCSCIRRLICFTRGTHFLFLRKKKNTHYGQFAFRKYSYIFGCIKQKIQSAV